MSPSCIIDNSVEWHRCYCMYFDVVKAVLLAMLVNFQWSVKFSMRMNILEEEDGVVLGVSRPLPLSLASGNWSKSILSAQAATLR